jgi:zinc/manganese transport system substrate-binding protein
MPAVRRTLPLLLLCVVVAAAVGCGGSSRANGDRLSVVAAENFWGSIAAQLGGDRVQVSSLIHNPATDPHDYEPIPADARSLAEAQLAVVNGLGYDSWASKLIAANPVNGRLVVTAADVVGAKAGGNPHLWYSSANVQRMIDAITASYIKLDPAHARYYDSRRMSFKAHALAGYLSLIASIRKKYAGVPVGASESIFELLARSLGLRLLTPENLLNAVSEGTDPTAAAKSEADRQLAGRQIKVWVYNSQNATPDVKRLTSEARARSIPVTTITETLTPAAASFQAWQTRQLRALEQALAKGTGR